MSLNSPVFVDSSGRRRRTLRRVGWLLGIACACYAVVLGVSLAGGNASAPWLPISGQNDTGSDKIVIPDDAEPEESPTPAASEQVATEPRETAADPVVPAEPAPPADPEPARPSDRTPVPPEAEDDAEPEPAESPEPETQPGTPADEDPPPDDEAPQEEPSPTAEESDDPGGAGEPDGSQSGDGAQADR
ncbi:hypothetical protein [Streptomyces sp. GSL17-111]|uniref:hypothetical protein n=1 Tax=Streptomyces sp. GSL17-111 TaxID=3121596 RepID=UPI0030F44502